MSEKLAMTQQQHWQRSLGIYKSIALVAGNMIGSGVLMLPSKLARLGSISLIGWLITSLGAIVLALIFSRLSQLIPQSGGPYAYVRRTYGEFIGFQIAYAYWVAQWIGNAAIAVAFVSYLGQFWPAVTESSTLKLAVGLGSVWFFTFINIWGVRESGVVQIILTITKLIPLILLTVCGLFYMDPHHLTAYNISDTSDFQAIIMAITLTLWSFIGLESATVPAEHVIKPEKTIPRATFLGTLIAALIYIVSTAVLMSLVPMQQLAQSDAPYAVAAYYLFGPYGRVVVGFSAIFMALGSLNGWVLLQGQIPYAAAEDGLFPRSFLKCTNNGSPYFGLITSSVLISVLLLMRLSGNLVDAFSFIILLATVMTLLPYLFSSLAELIYYLQHPESRPQKGLAFRIVLGALGFVYTYFAIIGAGVHVIYYLMLLLLLALPFYVWMKWEHQLPRSSESDL